MNLEPYTANGEASQEPKPDLRPIPGLLSFDGGSSVLPLNSPEAQALAVLANKQYDAAVQNGII